MAAPVLALAGTFVALRAVAQPQPPPPDRVASTVSYYQHHPLFAAAGAPVADGSALAASSVLLAENRPASAGARTRHPGQSRRADRAGRATPAAASSGTRSPSAGGQAPAATAALNCTGAAGTGMLPQNYATIVSFLAAHGYTDIAAAGIAGNIYQESDGNPESAGSGGGGLIGWTPLPGGFVTGNVAADLQTQLQALLSFNQQWAAYIPQLNAATSAAAAAYTYMTYFERPGFPAAANRENAAVAVAQACGITS